MVDGCKYGVAVARAEWQLEKFVGDSAECQDGIGTLLVEWTLFIVIVAGWFWRSLIVSSATA